MKEERVMLADTIERVNRLRKQALNNPEFLRSSKEHERTIASTHNHSIVRSSETKKRPKRFDEAFQSSQFGVNPSGSTH
jgi:hypothetical protein